MTLALLDNAMMRVEHLVFFATYTRAQHFVLLFAAKSFAQRPGWRHGKWIMGSEAPDDVKSEWPSRPPMFTRAPPENKAPAPMAKKDRDLSQVSVVDLGMPLWATPAHRKTENVVTGLALNYKESSHRFFVGSLRRAGYSGDIVIVTEPLARMQSMSARYLQSMSVIAYAIDPKCSAKGGSIKHKTCEWKEGQPALPLAIIRHACYLAIASMYSEQSQFYVADYRDTFFQRNPFEDTQLTGLQLMAVAEHWPFKQIGNCPFNGGWVRNCWGKNVMDAIGSKVVLCSGSYMGAQPAIVNFEKTLLAEVLLSKCHERNVPSDQGYLNYLYYTNQLPSETFVQDRGNGVVNTIGSLDGSRPRKAGYLPTTHVNIGEYWQIRDSDGYVLEDDKVTRSAAVHQYDRFHLEFRDFVANLGACDAPDCYQHPI